MCELPVAGTVVAPPLALAGKDVELEPASPLRLPPRRESLREGLAHLASSRPRTAGGAFDYQLSLPPFPLESRDVSLLCLLSGEL